MRSIPCTKIKGEIEGFDLSLRLKGCNLLFLFEVRLKCVCGTHSKHVGPGFCGPISIFSIYNRGFLSHCISFLLCTCGFSPPPSSQVSSSFDKVVAGFAGSPSAGDFIVQQQGNILIQEGLKSYRLEPPPPAYRRCRDPRAYDMVSLISAGRDSLSTPPPQTFSTVS